MRQRILRLSTSLLPLGGVLLSTSAAFAADWETISDYGGSTNMVIYVPDDVADSPAITVALHSCGNQYEGDSQNYFAGAADEHGFIIIAPTNGSPDCWEATAGQAGEKPDILQMVQWTIDNHNADASRVFVGGASSGACMTMALVASHPDVFAAGTMMAGVPFGAWSGGGSCGVCNAGASPKSEQEWGDIVRSNAPQGFTGPWPRLQVWHGDADSTLVYGWVNETEKQWKDVLGITGDGTAPDAPGGWNRTEYEEGGTVVLQVNRGPGMDHYLPDDVPQEEMISFFGLDEAPVVEPMGSGGDSGSAGGPGTGGDAGITTGGAGGSVSTSGGAANTGMGGSADILPASGGATVTPGAGGTAQGTGGLATGGAATTGGSSASGTGAAANMGVPPTTGEEEPSDDEGGCAFRAPQASSPRGFFALLFATGLGSLLLRRRARQSPVRQS